MLSLCSPIKHLETAAGRGTFWVILTENGAVWIGGKVKGAQRRKHSYGVRWRSEAAFPRWEGVFRVRRLSQEQGRNNVTHPRGGHKTHCTIFNLHFPCILWGDEFISVHCIFKFQRRWRSEAQSGGSAIYRHFKGANHVDSTHLIHVFQPDRAQYWVHLKQLIVFWLCDIHTYWAIFLGAIRFKIRVKSVEVIMNMLI